MRLAALACTGDPLLDQLLGECASLALVGQPACERASDVLPLLTAEPPALIFVSAALADAEDLLKVRGPRFCWLAEGSDTDGGVPAPPGGVEVLRAEKLTTQLIDAWVRRLQKPPVRQVPPPAPVRPPLRPRSPSDGDSQETPDEPATAPGTRPRFPALSSPAARVPTPGGWPKMHALKSSPPAPSLPAGRAGPGTPSAPALRPPVRVIRQQVVALWGGKPGAGRSTMAVALADLLARSGDVRVCTVDLNPYNSSLSPLLGKEQEVPSWVHLAEAAARSQPLPGSGLHWIRPNWALVSGPDGRPDLVARVTPEAIAWLVDELRSQFDYIILDPEARPGPVRDAAARLAQLVLVTVTCDYPDVLDTARGFEAAVEQGVLARDRCRLVLSRWLETPHLTQEEVAECFGLPVAAVIPLMPEAVLQAAGEARPVTRLSDPRAGRLVHALQQLLDVVAPALAAAGGDRSRSAPGSAWLDWLTR